MRWIDRAVIKVKEKNFGFILFQNKYFKYDRLYTPAREWACDMVCLTEFDLYDFFQTVKEAPLLKKRILDESAPLKLDILLKKKGDNTIDGGRISDAYLLGLIKYHEAIPELLEAVSHDNGERMREECAKSLGKMGSKAFNCAQALCKILLNDRSVYVKREVAKTLGEIKNPVSIMTLRNAFEEAQLLIRQLEVEVHDYKKENLGDELYGSCFLLENIIVSLFQLDKKQGREVLAEGLNYNSRSVRHHSKNACFYATHEWITLS